MGAGRHLLLDDGVCGLCNRLDRFTLRRDRSNPFRFARFGGAPDLDNLATFDPIAGDDSPQPRPLAPGDRADLLDVE